MIASPSGGDEPATASVRNFINSASVFAVARAALETVRYVRQWRRRADAETLDKLLGTGQRSQSFPKRGSARAPKLSLPKVER
jgi:hypothetical protein